MYKEKVRGRRDACKKTNEIKKQMKSFHREKERMNARVLGQGMGECV